MSIYADLQRLSNQDLPDAVEAKKLLRGINDTYGYLLGMLEDHNGTTPTGSLAHCAGVVCQKGQHGEFRKVSKCVRGHCYGDGPPGSILLFDEYDDAVEALAHIRAQGIDWGHAIFPVVLQPGYKPKEVP